METPEQKARRCIDENLALAGWAVQGRDGVNLTHVHVARERKLAKFWLGPVGVATNFGFGQREIHRLTGLVGQHETEFLKAWHEYFGIPGEDGGGPTRSRH